jgi:subtilisin family serine protease
MGTIDPRLRRLTRQAEPSRELAERVGISLEAEAVVTAAPVEVLVRCTDVGAVSEIQRAGMSVRAMTPGPHMVLSGVAPLDALDRLASIPGVERVEASRHMVPDLDLSRAETHVLPLHNGYLPMSGAGVIVGIIDSGIDYTHPDFLHADGSSRILYLWDQNAPAPTYGGVPYGHLYTKADLDAALYSATPLRGDPDAHGTHVSGIAAGNGHASYGVFTGIAPEADLIVVASSTDERTTLGRSVRIFEAFTNIVSWANSLGRPVAINQSQGMNGGGHSGETLMETGMDNLARQPGVVIVKSAGNEQELRIHAGGQIAQGQMIELGLSVQDNNSLDDILEIWSDDEDKISVAVQPPGSPPLDFVTPGNDQQFQTPAGNSVSVDFDLDMDGTGDTLVTIILTCGQAPFIQPGTWKLLLRGDLIRVGRFDAWIERTARDQPSMPEQTRFTEASADGTRTISIPGTARRVITVGSYITRPRLTSPFSTGQISAFSGRGPTRYGMQKPEIAAPGEGIVAARSSQSVAEPFSTWWSYTAMAGTSMAAPHVTGAAALILSVRPDLICEQVKQVLMQTARRDELTVSAPDSIWGAGKLDILAAVSKALTVRFPRVSNVSVSAGELRWQTDLPTTSAVRYHTNQRRLQLGKNLGSKTDLVLRTDHTMALTGVPADTYYCEILAYTEDNLFTRDDNGGLFYTVVIP